MADAPKRRRGGRELPDEVQDRPEQNKGYDEAVQGGPVPANEGDTAETVPAPPDERREREQRELDERATREAVRDVRRRERSAD